MHQDLNIAGRVIHLLPERAVYLPDREMLLVADLHIGKAASFRALGMPVPSGTTADTLNRLTQLLARYPCRHLLILGDFLHSKYALPPSTLLALHDWRNTHPDLPCTLIRGNHDLSAGDPPASLNFEISNEPLLIDSLALCHKPRTLATYHVLAGHVHPVFKLRGRGGQKLRLPCYCHESGITLLPAFGEFTGGADVTMKAGRQIFVTSNEAVWAVPERRANWKTQ